MSPAYIGEDEPDEPEFQYIPDTHHITTTLPPGADPLASSLLLLQEGLESSAALAQFEVRVQTVLYSGCPLIWPPRV